MRKNILSAVALSLVLTPGAVFAEDDIVAEVSFTFSGNANGSVTPVANPTGGSVSDSQVAPTVVESNGTGGSVTPVVKTSVGSGSDSQVAPTVVESNGTGGSVTPVVNPTGGSVSDSQVAPTVVESNGTGGSVTPVANPTGGSGSNSNVAPTVPPVVKSPVGSVSDSQVAPTVVESNGTGGSVTPVVKTSVGSGSVQNSANVAPAVVKVDSENANESGTPEVTKRKKLFKIESKPISNEELAKSFAVDTSKEFHTEAIHSILDTENALREDAKSRGETYEPVYLPFLMDNHAERTKELLIADKMLLGKVVVDLSQSQLKKIADNAKGIKANSEAIASHEEKVRINKRSIDNHSENIDKHANNIDANTQSISAHQEKIVENTENIQVNQKAISAHQEKIVENTENIQVNQKAIVANAKGVTSNLRSISALNDDVALFKAENEQRVTKVEGRTTVLEGRMSTVESQVSKLEKQNKQFKGALAATAALTQTANIPETPGKVNLNAGIGYYDGATAVAVGLSGSAKLTEKTNLGYNLGVGMGSQQKGPVVGAGVSIGLN